MDYEVNILVNILHRFNLGWIVTYMGEEEPNGSFMDTWLDSPYIYDSYETNYGDSVTVMTQFRYEGWNTDIITFQVWIEHLGGRIWELEKAKRLLLKFGRRGKVKREATWNRMSNHTNSTWIWNLRRLIIFIQYKDHPWEEAFWSFVKFAIMKKES